MRLFGKRESGADSDPKKKRGRFRRTALFVPKVFWTRLPSDDLTLAHDDAQQGQPKVSSVGKFDIPTSELLVDPNEGKNLKQ